MPLIDDVIEYAKGNAATAKSLDEQQTWAAHYRSLVEIRRQYEQQINDCLAAFTGRHESDAKVIAALREALKMVYSAYDTPAWLEELPRAMVKLKVIIDANEQNVGKG